MHFWCTCAQNTKLFNGDPTGLSRPCIKASITEGVQMPLGSVGPKYHFIWNTLYAHVHQILYCSMGKYFVQVCMQSASNIYMNSGLQPTMVSWAPPFNLALTQGLPGLLGTAAKYKCRLPAFYSQCGGLTLCQAQCQRRCPGGQFR